MSRYRLTLCRAGLPLRGVDGRPLDLGAADWHTTDAAVSKQIALMQAANLAEIDKLNARLRKEYDAAKLENKRRQKELQAVTSELTTIERIVSGSDRTSGPIAAADATVTEYEAKIAAVQEQLTVRQPTAIAAAHRITRPYTRDRMIHAPRSPRSTAPTCLPS